ncbi:hypothetical protein LCGC14_1123500 [marine sediment metagenome]|uniref:Uncharacterized protein n=1 Tax=marine sediment metagenome TaxID=412755 RepID=A0A0F9Q946_9ZZZZ
MSALLPYCALLALFAMMLYARHLMTSFWIWIEKRADDD